MAADLGRLRKRSEFLAVAATNRRWTSPGLVLQARRHSSSDGPSSEPALRPEPALRIGFTATKKIGSAVVRNRAKRRLRAVAREVLGAVEARPADLVLVARQGTVSRPYADLTSDLRTALDRLGIVAR
jgi:ribonuclease P protein component